MSRSAAVAGKGSGVASRPALWWGLSAAALVLGYADLWRGGITIAPMLLVLAYCVLIPIAILKVPSGE